jgi:hypothetical protein
MLEQLNHQFSRQCLFGHLDLEGRNGRFERILGDPDRPAHCFHLRLILSQAKLGQNIACIRIIRLRRAILDIAEFQQPELARLNTDSLPIQAEALGSLSKYTSPLGWILRIGKDLEIIRERCHLLQFQLRQYDRGNLVLRKQHNNRSFHQVKV